MKERGKITISNPKSTRNPNGWIALQIVGVETKTVIDIEMDLSEFALALTGLSRVACEIEHSMKEGLADETHDLPES